MTKALYTTGLVFWLIGLILLLPSALYMAGDISLGGTTLSSAVGDNTTGLLALVNSTVIAMGSLIVGAIFICAGAIIQSRSRQ